MLKTKKLGLRLKKLNKIMKFHSKYYSLREYWTKGSYYTSDKSREASSKVASL